MRTIARMAIMAAAFSVAGITAASADRYLRVDHNWFWRYYDEHYCLISPIEQMADCSFPTFQSCQATNSGLGGTCFVNPRHVDAMPPLRPHKRHHRRARR